jgi:hypothetical protein
MAVFIPCDAAGVGVGAYIPTHLGGRDPAQWIGCPGRRVHWNRVLVLDRNVTPALTVVGARGAWHPSALRVRGGEDGCVGLCWRGVGRVSGIVVFRENAAKMVALFLSVTRRALRAYVIWIVLQ